jgi:formamidopyrimidine-DNA glycosylase
MPELPEVETTRRGILPWLQGKKIMKVVVREPRLRWPISTELAPELAGQTVTAVDRRGKYLLMRTRKGTVLIHLGMSGSLRLAVVGEPLKKHDHVDFILASGRCLRYHDPRRFGCILWVEGNDAARHPLLAELGPEPLSSEFTGDYLLAKAEGKTTPVKALIMDSQVVVGVGNIYANEALFAAGIDPARKAGTLTIDRCEALVREIKTVLDRAINVGGTTLRDFVGGDGKPGYFAQTLQVYGRGGQTCVNCMTPLKETRQGQRTTVYCPRCQS